MEVLNGLMYVVIAIIAVVVAHGFYQKWRDRRNRVIMKLDPNIPQADIDLDLLPNSELPNGGARSIPREAEPVIPRKRYQLKDGRDKVRQSEPEPGNVPVLMDPLEIAEADIEHANVYITAQTLGQETSATFTEEELAPEVMAGLDDDQQAGQSAQPDEEDADEFLAATADPLAEEDEFPEGFSEEFEGEFEDEIAEEPTAATSIAHDRVADDDATAELPEDTAYEDEEEYDPYEDENFYENEPALLENAYKLATRGFHRQQEPQAPRIEPGFGETQGEEVGSAEEFVSALNEDAMDEFLDQEQEEIRAWRSQSVTQQDAPLVPPATNAPVVEARPAAKPVFEPAIVAAAAPARIAEAALPPLVADEQAEAVVAKPRAAEPARESKPGFWQSMTGKTAKSVKATTAKIAQGELFHEAAPAHPAPEPEPEPSGPQEVMIVNVMAKPGFYFYGDELLPVLQHFGLRLGQMNIFHRHTETDGTGSVMFSMANMVKPGTFALNSLEEFATPGISFFVQLPNRHGNMKAFEMMLATANGVKQALDGTLKDERRSVLTRQTVEHCRQRIRDFELSLLARK